MGITAKQMQPLNCLPYLRAFDAVVQHGTLRGASDELGITPGAVSMQLKKLYEVTGVVFFEKSGRGLELTPAGKAFAKVVRRNLVDISIGVQEASTARERADRPLRISIPMAIGVSWLASAVVAYSLQAGIEKVLVSAASDFADVNWAESDLAIVWGSPPFPNCWWKHLADLEARPVCAPRLLASLDLDWAKNSLNNVAILHEDQGETWQRWSAKACVSIEDASHIHFPTPAMAHAAAVQGLGIALISDQLAKKDITEGRLRPLFQTSLVRTRGYYFVCPEERSGQSLVTSAVSFISAYLG